MQRTDVLVFPRVPVHDGGVVGTVDGDAPTFDGDGAPRKRHADEVPDRVGRYVVFEPIGRGGMGVVFAAYDPELDRKVAIKLLDPRRDDLAARVRLLREAQAMAKLQHPNVIAVHDVGTFEDRVFVAMEFVRGRTLGLHLATARPWREALALSIAAGRGLAAAHAVGLVHRDFKPDNVLVSDDGRVRVGDFGLARAFEGANELESDEPGRTRAQPSALGATASLHVTQTGALLGTPAYMAPEQHARRPTDARSDQFSFCVVLYEALFGERPYPGRTVAEISASVLAGDARPPPRVPAMPLAIGRAIARGLATDPEERWPDMASLLSELERAPRRARRRWTIVGGSTVLGGLLAADLALSREVTTCRDEASLLEGLWDGERRDEVETAMLATGVTYAADTWRRLDALVDARAHEWAAHRIELCEAHERHDVSDALFDRSVACLAERKSELSSLLDVLTVADAMAVQNAVTAASELTAISACDELGRAAARIELPPDETVAARVAELRAQLEGARITGETGRLTEAREQIERATADAEAIGYRPALAEARLRLAWIHDRLGEYETAEITLRSAWFDALASGHDEVAARAATDLLLVLGVRQTHFDEAASWARNAEALIERLPDDAGLAARYHASLGNFHGKRGDNSRAIAELRTAVEIESGRLGDDHLAVARHLGALGLALQRAGEYDAAQHELGRVLEIQERALGADHPDVATTLNNIGTLHARRGRFDAARNAHERALAIRIAGLGPDHPDTASSHTNLGIALRHLGRWDTAATHLRAAVEIKTKTLGDDDPQVADAITNLGNLDFARDDFAAAEDAYHRALDIYVQAFGPEHPDVGAAMNNVGIVQWKRGEYDAARLTLMRALSLWERVLGPEHPDLAATLLGLGEVALARGRPAEAVGHLERAVVLLERATPDSELLADVRFALARSLADRDAARAFELAKQAALRFTQSGSSARGKLDRVETFLAGSRDRPAAPRGPL